jgi:2OG-Fe(II) oxygenase superfamily
VHDVLTSTALGEEELLRLGRDRATEYAEAAPFPHAVLDGFFDPAALEQVAREFPPLDDPVWTTYEGPSEGGKQEASDSAYWGPSVRQLIAQLSSPPWLGFVEELTGLHHLVPDPHGGGMHQSGPGARLSVHVDFNLHPELPLERLVNVILYLNPDWDETAGGSLELWTESERARSILPLFNRCVVFSASERSFHGHPVPVAGGIDPATGETRRRRSIAMYYYGRRGEEPPERHSTIWLSKAKPGRLERLKRWLGVLPE